jgi:hypothetical protein
LQKSISSGTLQQNQPFSASSITWISTCNPVLFYFTYLVLSILNLL